MVYALACIGITRDASAQDDARMRQLRLLCAQLSGDLTDPGGIAAFRHCLSSQDPLSEIRRDNQLGGNAPAAAVDHPGANPPKGFGHDGQSLLADGVMRFATQDGKLFYAIDKDAKLWRWNATTKDSHMVDEQVAAVESIDDGHVMVLDNGGRLWLETGAPATRAPIDQNVVSFQSVGVLVYVHGRDGKLWRETGNADSRALVDQQVASFHAVDSSFIFVLGNDGKLWRERGDARDRTEVANTVAAFQYLPDGDTTYVLARDGTLWRQEGDRGKSEQVDHGVTAFQALDTHVAYVLSGDGRLWQELGNRDRSVLVDSSVLAATGRAAFQAIDPQHVYLLSVDHKLWAETMPANR
jgi:hypothetical protein